MNKLIQCLLRGRKKFCVNGNTIQIKGDDHLCKTLLH